jgi:hypothetical protein
MKLDIKVTTTGNKDQNQFHALFGRSSHIVAYDKRMFLSALNYFSSTGPDRSFFRAFKSPALQQANLKFSLHFSPEFPYIPFVSKYPVNLREQQELKESLLKCMLGQIICRLYTIPATQL